jgi:hypothetical protein
VNAGYLPPSGAGNVVDRSTRQGILGQVRYTDSRRREWDLPYTKYYFLDPLTDQVFPSELPDPPNDGRSYERLIPRIELRPVQGPGPSQREAQAGSTEGFGEET